MLGGLCNNGVGCVGGVGFCAMTETGQIKEKTIFHTVRIRTRGVGRSATLRFQRGDNALPATYYDQFRWLNKQVKPFFGLREGTDSK